MANFAEALDTQARAAGVLAITGASSTPALSHAALTPLVANWSRLDNIVVAICPGANAPRGLSVIQAILSYAGRPVRIFSDGHWMTSHGWSKARRLDIPGLGRRWASLCETPDLDLLPARSLCNRAPSSWRNRTGLHASRAHDIKLACAVGSHGVTETIGANIAHGRRTFRQVQL